MHETLPNIEQSLNNFCIKHGFKIDEEQGSSKEYNAQTCDEIKYYVYKYYKFTIVLEYLCNNQKCQVYNANKHYKNVKLITGYKDNFVQYQISIINNQLDTSALNSSINNNSTVLMRKRCNSI